jgi:hypothetical protein
VLPTPRIQRQTKGKPKPNQRNTKGKPKAQTKIMVDFRLHDTNGGTTRGYRIMAARQSPPAGESGYDAEVSNDDGGTISRMEHAAESFIRECVKSSPGANPIPRSRMMTFLEVFMRANTWSNKELNDAFGTLSERYFCVFYIYLKVVDALQKDARESNTTYIKDSYSGITKRIRERHVSKIKPDSLVYRFMCQVCSICFTQYM